MRTGLGQGVLLVMVFLGLASAVQAHELRPGYLEVRQLQADSYDLLWKVPARGAQRLALRVRLPDSCQGTEPSSRPVNGAFVDRWRVRCEGGLAGREIRIDGLADTRTDVLARIQRLDGGSQTIRLTPESVAFVVTGTPSTLELAGTYTSLGIEHILLGVDHLLFVLGLLWLVSGAWMLVKTITAFTVAHSLSLAAATLGWIGVPERPVNAAIALSIVFIAVEVVKLRRGEPGLTTRFPWIVAFAFGLLHGLGFASALTGLGLPATEIPLALLFFNVGVEIGQLAFVCLALALAGALRLLRTSFPPWAEATSVYAVGSLAAFWFLQRTLPVLNL